MHIYLDIHSFENLSKIGKKEQQMKETKQKKKQSFKFHILHIIKPFYKGNAFEFLFVVNTSELNLSASIYIYINIHVPLFRFYPKMKSINHISKCVINLVSYPFLFI